MALAISNVRKLYLLLMCIVLHYVWNAEYPLPDDGSRLKIEPNEKVDKKEHKLRKSIVGSPDSTIVKFGDCACNLIDIDCLDFVKCLDDQEAWWERISMGILTRRLMRKIARPSQEFIWDTYIDPPMGKAMQTCTKHAWREWLQTNKLGTHLKYYIESYPFIDEKLYPTCIKEKFHAYSCLFADFLAEEQLGSLEKQSMKEHGHQHYASDADTIVRAIRALRKNPRNVSPYRYLLAFCHMARIVFNVRPFVLEIYEKRLKVIEGSAVVKNKKVFRVAMHVRRGDACRHVKDNYAKELSPLDSPAQISSERLCYDTAVYMKALSRAQGLVGADTLLHVHVGTDHASSLLHEIEAQFPQLYNSIIWKVVEYDRTVFDYAVGQEGIFIESPENENRGILGESAAVDIWHLSHGQVFIGHLGSRFGKLSWWQAMARHNTFVPYLTVDGHSSCCDIDEPCGRVAPAIVSMENCLTFSRDSSMNHEAERYRVVDDEYWTVGSMHRFINAGDELSVRRRKNQDYPIDEHLMDMLKARNISVDY